MGKSEKAFVPILLLCFFLGALGVHRFYAGKVGTGILMLLTFGGLGIWALIDFVIIACGSFKDGQGLPIKNWSILNIEACLTMSEIREIKISFQLFWILF